MARVDWREDPHRFVHYYESQVGGNLPGFYGAPVMYGRGIGSIFSKLFRFISPVVKKGFALAKPHLKAAASNIASDVFSNVGKFVSGEQKQEGSGGIMVLARRQRRRPPGERLTATSKKRSAGKKRKSVARSRRVKRKSPQSSDIF
ncbi:cupiennin [Xyrichtys novacula]|uniref:TPA_asm: cupiennin n=1 Tax=Xyrichtys novacula TaxID=13765 RepID=A0AAV1G0E9_XYRNO|nr:cupiennin [Xyrichtys novacula]